MRVLPAVVLLSASMVGCGGRSAIGWRARGGSDGGSLPDRSMQPVPPVDMGVISRIDRARPIDRSCLPVPAGEVQGSYKGSWKGSWGCPGQALVTIDGSLNLTLKAAAGPANFSVSGFMQGVIYPYLPFQASVNGTMSCTALNASLPSVIVGREGIMYKMTGTMTGHYAVSLTSKGGFPDGTWAVKQVDGSCTASGSWFANKL